MIIHVIILRNNSCDIFHRCPALALKLDAEKAAQASHVKRIKNKLREIKGGLFNDEHGMHKENVDVSPSQFLLHG